MPNFHSTKPSINTSIITKYETWVSDELAKCEAPNDFIEFFKKNSALTKHSMLFPTSLTDLDLKKFLCGIALDISKETQLSPVEIMFPGVSVDSLHDNFPNLNDSNLDLMAICQTHILSEDGQYLLPVKLLVSNQVFNPYYDYKKGGNPNITSSEWTRMEQHSDKTRHYIELSKEIKSLEEKTDNLYLRIRNLCQRLSLNDAHGGRGQEHNAGAGAYPAIIDFFDYYNKLTETEKNKIPHAVRQALYTLYNLSSNQEDHFYATRNVETCIGLRREAIEQSIAGLQNTLEQIGFSGEQIHHIKQQKEAEKEKIRQAILAGNDSGFDGYSFNDKLLKELGIRLTFNNLEDLNLLKSLEPDEFKLVCEQSSFLQVLKTFDEFIAFTRELPSENLAILCRLNHLSWFLTSEQVVKEWLISLYPSQQISAITALLALPETSPISKYFSITTLLNNTYLEQNVSSKALEEFLGKLDKQRLYKFLTQTNWGGFNTLMLAAQYQPAAVAPLLASIATLSPTEQANIFTQTNRSGWNALMIAAGYQPAALELFLASIATLSPTEQIKIFTQTNLDGWNALMLVAWNQPAAVGPLFEKTNSLILEEHVPISTKTKYFSFLKDVKRRDFYSFLPNITNDFCNILARDIAVKNYQAETQRFGFQAENLEGKSAQEIKRITPSIWMYVCRRFCEFIVACCNRILGNNSSPNSVQPTSC